MVQYYSSKNGGKVPLNYGQKGRGIFRLATLLGVGLKGTEGNRPILDFMFLRSLVLVGKQEEPSKS